MENLISELRQNLDGVIRTELRKTFDNNIEESKLFVQNLKKIRTEYFGSLTSILEKDVKSAYITNEKIISEVKSFFARHDPVEMEIFFQTFEEQINQIINQLPENIINEQNSSLFSIQQEDGFFLKFIKVPKIFLYKVYKSPFLLLNALRKLFRKESRYIKFWNHKIPFRNFAREHFYNLFGETINETYNLINSKRNSIIEKLWDEDNKLDYDLLSGDEKSLSNVIPDYLKKTDEIYSEIDQLKSESAEKLETVFNELFEIFNRNIVKVGTIEHNAGSYNLKKVASNTAKLHKKFRKSSEHWNDTKYLFSEDWLQDLELLLFRFNLLINQSSLVKRLNDFFSDKIIPKVGLIEKELGDHLADIVRQKNDSSISKEYFLSLKAILENKLNGVMIRELEKSVLDQSPASFIEDFERDIYSNLGLIASKRSMISSPDYSLGYDKSQFGSFSPRELAEAELFDASGDQLKNLKSKIFNDISKLQIDFYDIFQIADFTLESAIELIENPDKDEKSPFEVSINGFNRAIEKVQSSQKTIEKLFEVLQDEINSIVTNINERLFGLTENEKVISLKIRLAKVKARSKAELVKDSALKKTKIFYSEVPLVLKKIPKFFRTKYELIADKFGLRHKVGQISSEYSDFLAETEIAIQKLPFIYRRLFQIEPLKDERLFSGRQNEIGQMFKVFENWEKGRFAPILIVAEKGGGITSLINIFLNQFESRYPVFRSTIDSIIYQEKDFLSFICNTLQMNEVNSLAELIDKINNTQQRRLVIIENLQRLYLKKVDGFRCLDMLFELISKTNKKILWINSITFYSWSYLQKTLAAHDYYAYTIDLENLKDEEIIDIITKRHRISGFNLEFEPSMEMQKSKTLSKLTDEEKNLEFKKDYFSSLNKFARSNLSLALLFWTRSTKSVNDNTIVIEPIEKIEIGFIHSLSDKKLFALYNILIHDGLDSIGLSLVTGYSKDACGIIIMQLYDDGILVKKADLFLINPLLYRQIVNALKSKNIIH